MTSFDITHRRLYTQHIAMAHFEKSAGRRQQLDGFIITGGGGGNHGGGLQNNGGATDTQVPSSGSPAINQGDNAACPPTDQRGWHRPIGVSCDIGAVEVGPYLYLPLIRR